MWENDGTVDSVFIYSVLEAHSCFNNKVAVNSTSKLFIFPQCCAYCNKNRYQRLLEYYLVFQRRDERTACRSRGGRSDSRGPSGQTVGGHSLGHLCPRV